MKRLLVFVFAVVLFWSCKKRKTVHFEGLMMSNTNIVYFKSHVTTWDMEDYNVNSTYEMNSGYPGNEIPISVGENYVSVRNSRAKKDDIIPLSLVAFCDSTLTITGTTLGANITDTIQCDFELSLGFFVDDVLVEERIISNSSNEIIQMYEGREDILQKTINFTVP